VKSTDLELLKKIARVEDSLDPDSFPSKAGWRSRDVGLWPGTLTRLCINGLVEDVYQSNSYHGYRLTERARALLANSIAPQRHQDEQVALPDDLFEEIIGHEEVKELLRAAMTADKPVHVLLTGPPALAKSLFLWDLEKAYGEKALWLVGSAISKAGLWDLLAERKPRVLLIDELDKVNAADTAALLSIMEGGRLVRAKKGRGLDTMVDTRVVAATNTEGRLSPELRSRFAIRRLYAYSGEEFKKVVRGVLVKREGLKPEAAMKIATRLTGMSQDVRDAVRVARLSPSLGISKAISLLLKGRG